MTSPTASETPSSAGAALAERPGEVAAAHPEPPSSDADNLQRLGRSSAAYALTSVLHKGSGVLLLPLYTHLMGVDEYGALCLVLSVCAFLQVVFMLGMMAHEGGLA